MNTPRFGLMENLPILLRFGWEYLHDKPMTFNTRLADQLGNNKDRWNRFV